MNSTFTAPSATRMRPASALATCSASRRRLFSSSSEKTGTKNYNPSCSMNMPLRSSDSESLRRSAAYAKFANRKTGKRFWVVSVHLDDRHSSTLSREKSYNALRGRQATAVYLKVNGLRKAGEEIIFAGDFNSWATNRAGDAPHEYLVRQGFYDTVAADARINIKYPTVNHFKTTVPAKRILLDYVMVKGGKKIAQAVIGVWGCDDGVGRPWRPCCSSFACIAASRARVQPACNSPAPLMSDRRSTLSRATDPYSRPS
jgi:hypothetical protein